MPTLSSMTCSHMQAIYHRYIKALGYLVEEKTGHHPSDPIISCMHRTVVMLHFKFQDALLDQKS